MGLIEEIHIASKETAFAVAYEKNSDRSDFYKRILFYQLYSGMMVMYPFIWLYLYYRTVRYNARWNKKVH